MVSTKPGSAPVDDRARRLENEQMRKAQQAGRLSQARESTLDYQMGIKHAGGSKGMGRPNPVSVKGWTNLVEDRIERARQLGLFKVVKGRGKPLIRSTDEQNPFIAREEFLMNRIVQRNGAAPPWVEIQGELEPAVVTFREILRQSWIRRSIRMLVLSHPDPYLLSKLTLDDIKARRDSEWVQKEKSYHETAIAELNELVRKYNGLAPYIVRKNYYIREVEIDRLYNDCAEEIFKGILERREAGFMESGQAGSGRGSTGEGSVGFTHENAPATDNFGLVQWMRPIFHRLFGVRQ